MKFRINDKKWIIALLILVTGLCICLVTFSAKSAQMQFDLNKLNSEVKITENKVANLEVQIRSLSNVNNIEEKALALGFVYPEYNQVVRISLNKEPNIDLAAVLRENAYN